MSAVRSNATMSIKEVTCSGGAWTKLLDANADRHYLMITNDNDAHSIAVGFGDTAPTIGFDIKGSATAGDPDARFEFTVAPTNAVWAKASDTHDHDVTVVYDD